MTAIPIDKIPSSELVDDLYASIMDAKLCEFLIVHGRTEYGNGKSIKYRLGANQDIIELIETELERREIMATKEHIILFETLSEARNTFAVYTDLPKDALLTCDGVAAVDDIPLDIAGYLVITIDKRYDAPSVLQDIKALAEEEEAVANDA